MRCPCGADHTLPGRKRPASRVADPVDAHLTSQEFRRLRAMAEPENVPAAYQEDNPHPVYAAAFPRCRGQGPHRTGEGRATARVRYTENGRDSVTVDMCDRHAALTRERYIREGRRGVEIMPAGWTPPSWRAAEAQRWDAQVHLYATDPAVAAAENHPVVRARPGWGASDMADAFHQQAGGRSWVVPDVNAYQVQADVRDPQIQAEAEAAHRFLMQERGRSR